MNLPNTGAQNMAIRSQEKLDQIARLYNLISEAKGQLQQARTEKERESLNDKTQGLKRMIWKHDQVIRKRRRTLRANKAASRPTL
jgi:hypothetical protein